MLTCIKKTQKQTTKHTKLNHDRYFLAGFPTSGSIRYVSIFLFPYLSILILIESNRNTSQERCKTCLLLFSFVKLHTTLHCMKVFMKLVSPKGKTSGYLFLQILQYTVSEIYSNHITIHITTIMSEVVVFISCIILPPQTCFVTIICFSNDSTTSSQSEIIQTDLLGFTKESHLGGFLKIPLL